MAGIVPFSFLCANYTEPGKKLQQFFKRPTNENLYDAVKKEVEQAKMAGKNMDLYLEYRRRGGEFVDELVKDCPILGGNRITINNDSCVLPCGHVLSKTAVNGMLAAKGNPIECPFCRTRTNVAYEMCPHYGQDYGPISGGKKKHTRKNKHKMRKSRKAKKSRKLRKSSRKH